MKIVKLFFVALLLFAFIEQAQSNDVTASQALSQLLSKLQAFKADFKQKTYNAQNKLLQTSYGKLALLRPGHFRWETLSPMHQLLITNGKNLWIYDVDLEQVTQQKLQDQGELNPAQLLSGSINSLEQQFSVSYVQNKQGPAFKLIPKSKEASVSWINLQFKNQQLVSMQFANELGEINDFQFSHIQNSANLKAQDFNFIAPPGVDVLVNS